MNETLVNLLAGVTQATAVTIVGYPFDFVKARLQTGNYRNSVHCIVSSVRAEGFSVLYRGATAPWISHLIKRPVQYPMAEWMKKQFGVDGKAVRPSDNYLIGGVTGAAGPAIGTPLQVVKLGMQTTKAGEYTTLSYLQHLIQTKGPQSLYRGFTATATKDVLFGASFLGHYYTMRDHFEVNPYGLPANVTIFFSGASAHCGTWLLLIPIDTIKSRVQRAGETRSVKAIIASTIREDGILALWRGVVPACVRTIPVSGFAMVGYEWTRRFFSELCT